MYAVDIITETRDGARPSHMNSAWENVLLDFNRDITSCPQSEVLHQFPRDIVTLVKM